MSEQLKLVVEILTVAIALGTILWRLSVATTTFTLIGSQQAKEISEMKVALDKMEAAVTAIALYDFKLTSLVVRMDTADKRVDDRFARNEAMLDELRHGRGIIKSP